MRHIVMPDGKEIQVKPIMDKTQYFTSGIWKYFTYEKYLNLCKQAKEIFDEDKLLKKATGLRRKPMTQQEWQDYLAHAKEFMKIKKRREKHE